jgi:hypothetical protein
MREEIIITFDADTPKVKVEAVGVVGSGCKALTRPFEDALGILHGTDTLKNDYYLTAVPAALKVGKP